MVVAPIAWLRMLRAKTRAAYWKNIGLFVGPIFLVFLLANGAGLIPEFTTPRVSPSPQDVFGQMPTEQLVLLVLVAIIWIGGGNLLFHRHNLRLGKKWWQALNPLDSPFKDFNFREWLILGVLVVISLGLLVAVISLGQPSSL